MTQQRRLTQQPTTLLQDLYTLYAQCPVSTDNHRILHRLERALGFVSGD